MVEWGQNEVKSYDPKAPAGGSTAGFSFASTTPAATGTTGGGLFGSTTTTPAPAGGLFGSSTATNPAPAPFGSTGGLFGSTPAPSTGLFGAAPSSSGGLFGSTAPAPSTFGGGLFGSTTTSSPGLFGSPAPAPFGGSLFSGGTTAPAAPQVPAQAALQAHFDAQARQDEAKVRDKLQELHQAYSGTAQATNTKSAHFVSVVYNPTTPQQRQEQILRGVGLESSSSSWSSMPLAPPKPTQVSEEAWLQAIVRTPHPCDYAPIALVGAPALQGRLSGQQEQANTLMKHLEMIRSTIELLQGKTDKSMVTYIRIEAKQKALERQLLRVMAKVEVLRCFRTPLTQEESIAGQKLGSIYQQVVRLQPQVAELHAKQSSRERRPPRIQDVPDKEQLKHAFSMHRTALAKMIHETTKDRTDMELVLERLHALQILSKRR